MGNNKGGGGLVLWMGGSESEIIVVVDSSGSNKEDKKLDMGTETGASKHKGKDETEGGSGSDLGNGRMISGVRASVCILKSMWMGCLGTGGSVCMLQLA